MAFSEGRALPGEAAPVVRQRISLGRNRRRLSFERRIRLWVAAAALPFLVTLIWACRLERLSTATMLTVVGVCVAAWVLLSSYFFDSNRATDADTVEHCGGAARQRLQL